MKDVEIFTGPGCAHCGAAKALLEEHGVPFTERDVSDADVLAELQTRVPRARSIPQIFADGQHLGTEQDLRLALSDAER